MPLRVKVQPTAEPVSLSEAKTHLRVDTVDDDALISAMVSAARTNLERTYDLALTTQTLVVSLDAFPYPYWWGRFGGWSWGMNQPMSSGTIELTGPAQSITSVTYLDPTGTPQVLASNNYVLDSDSVPARLAPALNKVWPVTAPLPLAVQIEYIAGFGLPEQVPADIRAAVKLIVGHFYENREQNLIERASALELPFGVDALMAPYGPNLIA